MNLHEQFILNLFSINDLDNDISSLLNNDSIGCDSRYLSSFLAATMNSFLKTYKFASYEDLEDIEHINFHQIGFSSVENEQEIIKTVVNHFNRTQKLTLKHLCEIQSSSKRRKESLYPFTDKYAKRFIYFLMEKVELFVQKNHNLFHSTNWQDNCLIHLLAATYTMDMNGGHFYMYKVDDELCEDIMFSATEIWNQFNIQKMEKNEFLILCDKLMTFLIEMELRTLGYELNPKEVKILEPMLLAKHIKVRQCELNNIEFNDLKSDVLGFYKTNIHNHVLHENVLRYIRQDLIKNNAVFFKINIQEYQSVDVFQLSQSEIDKSIYENDEKQKNNKKRKVDMSLEDKRLEKELESQLVETRTIFCTLNKTVSNNLIGLIEDKELLAIYSDKLENQQIKLSEIPLRFHSFLDKNSSNSSNYIPKTAILI